MKMESRTFVPDDVFEVIREAATRHTSLVDGLRAKESGSTSPKNRNCFCVTVFRIKKADDV
jgi:hypothetical protein